MSEMLPVMHGALFPGNGLSYWAAERKWRSRALNTNIALPKYNACLKSNVEFQNNIISNSGV
jgi:hypothetical protein